MIRCEIDGENVSRKSEQMFEKEWTYGNECDTINLWERRPLGKGGDAYAVRYI